ncbi:hypothetical protein E2C01_010883 [Portunus trituberculatus]|uniref:Uncharacterized protein n=1 Tax=Portunus trituberculatus TaxID=210409 RepID=A0A5B7D9S9_PORTR|nr:hypothetical protein [Portunus trituberculatus]
MRRSVTVPSGYWCQALLPHPSPHRPSQQPLTTLALIPPSLTLSALTLPCFLSSISSSSPSPLSSPSLSPPRSVSALPITQPPPPSHPPLGSSSLRPPAPPPRHLETHFMKINGVRTSKIQSSKCCNAQFLCFYT